MSILAEPYFRVRKNNGVLFEPDVNTVLWLPGQDDAYSSIIRDRSGKGNDGTITGATWARTGQGLWYLSFDGDDNVDCGLNVASLELTTLSVLCWINPTTSADHKTIFNVADNAVVASGFTCAVRQNDDGTNPDELYTVVWSGATTLKYGSVVTYGTWQMVTMTLAGTALKLYQNITNTLDDTVAGVPIFTGDNRVVYGSGWASTPAYNVGFLGGLALPRVFPRILTLSEITNIYNQERHLFGV
ncbi:hypothetical protein LCGC14_1111330 [marine sediment metagenome]|uniref:LamG-like jellyroll fold domain-containing protein n=1 Tax=marine sediment metagenome TaxID=412755 RepID=A0A0F9MUJ5_9ZZZZ